MVVLAHAPGKRFQLRAEALGNLTNLTVLNVSGNALTGAASIRYAHFKLGKLV